ncbi:MAG: MgtC/SapB family protein [Syntrophomonadaceae bacterium]|jgi:putative Mg2+ transporter-C (MgtC) family protein
MTDYILRLVFAGIIGLLAGLSITDKRNARMFALTCIGAALITITSTEFYKAFAGPWFSDPGRLSAQVVSALGFIGTGLIWISDENRVMGLSVAGTLWLTAIMGVLIGAGLHYISVTAVFITVIIFWLVDLIIRRRILKKDSLNR